MVQSPAPLLTLLQLQSYLVLCTSARIFIIPKLRNIYWRKFFSEPFSLCIGHLRNCYSVRKSHHITSSFLRCRSLKEHLPNSLPSEKIFYLLRSIPLESPIRDYSAEWILDTLEIIIKWLQVSVNCNRQTPQTKIQILSRNLVPSDRPICTIASKVNSIVDTKLPLPQFSMTLEFDI